MEVSSRIHERLMSFSEIWLGFNKICYSILTAFKSANEYAW